MDRRARLELIWEDLVTPVRAIAGCQEIILEKGRRLELTDQLPFLEKVLAAAGSLSAMVDRLRDPAARFERDESDDLGGMQARLRHDLRTPLNAIIGYSEMVQEDLDGLPAGEALRPDIEGLLGEARHLLERIAGIVDRTSAPPASDSPLESAPADPAVADLLRALRPDRDAAKPNEVGRILAIDDNESNRDLLSRRLLQEGHAVVVASSGRQALDILESQAFDLILLDVLMPGMNGIEVLERLKADERWRHTPVVMISGLSETDAVVRCIELGAEDYLPKPFNLVLLRARIGACLERMRWRDREREYLARVQTEKERADALLRNILPEQIVLRLNAGDTIIADRFESVSILFADVVGFTPAAAAMPPTRIVERLNRIFTAFDALTGRLGVEKIKTIGDAYMAATGLPEPRADHADAMAEFALGMLDALDRVNEMEDGDPLQIRIGIHTGPVVAGIIGSHKFIYDVWGDTVNFASRLESQGLPHRIQVSQEVRDALAHKFAFEARGSIALKGRGEAQTFLLVPPNSGG